MCPRAPLRRLSETPLGRRASALLGRLQRAQLGVSDLDPAFGVGPVVGLDPAQSLMDEAMALDAKAGVTVEYRLGRAEDTGLPDAAFDVVTAGQCWHWFDGPAAAAEVRRLLRPGARVVITHFDWLPLSGNVVAATEALITKHNPAWRMGGGTGLYPEWLRHLGEAGFEDLRTFSFDLTVPYTHADWRGRIRASAGVGASLPVDAVAAFDREHEAILAERFAEDPLAVPHRVWAVIGRSPKQAT